MRIAVFGAGGAGGYFGGRLAQAGEDVIFIARGEHLRAIREHGLRAESVKGDFEIQEAQATDNPADVGEVDLVIVGVKAWQAPEAAQTIRPLLGPESYVLPLQNGVEASVQLEAVLGSDRVLGGLARIFSPYTSVFRLSRQDRTRLTSGRLHSEFIAICYRRVWLDHTRYRTRKGGHYHDL